MAERGQITDNCRVIAKPFAKVGKILAYPANELHLINC